MSASANDNWSRVAHLYAKVVDAADPNSPNGRANAQILSLLASPPSPSSLDSEHTPIPLSGASFVLDMGCGSGAWTSAFLADPTVATTVPSSARLVAADVATSFVHMLQQRREAEIVAAKTNSRAAADMWERLEIQQWDARALTEVLDGEVSHLLSTYAYFTMRGEQDALKEALRVLRPGGLFVETSMGETEWGFLPQLLKRVKPEKTIPEPAKHWWTADGTEGLLRGVGFRDVGAREFEISLPMGSAEEAVEFVVEVFPVMKELIADLTTEEVATMRSIMLEWVRERHPTSPFRMKGSAVMGWGRK